MEDSGIAPANIPVSCDLDEDDETKIKSLTGMRKQNWLLYLLIPLFPLLVALLLAMHWYPRIKLRCQYRVQRKGYTHLAVQGPSKSLNPRKNYFYCAGLHH